MLDCRTDRWQATIAPQRPWLPVHERCVPTDAVDLGITCSMSRTGDCYDNAVMERFFWSLKHEWSKHAEYAGLEDAHLSVFKYIETFYNPVRIHQTLGYLSPDE